MARVYLSKNIVTQKVSRFFIATPRLLQYFYPGGFIKKSAFVFTFFFAKLIFATEPLVSESCNEFIKSLPPAYVRGWLEVPENWAAPDAKKIKVFYYTRIQPKQTPVIFLNGGPIGEDHSSYTFFEQYEAASGLGFIYIDQRGTGCSTLIPNSQDVATMAASSFYSTDQISYDLEYLRIELLGSPRKWKVFGQSFGGAIANRYLTQFPESVISVHNYSGGFTENFVHFFYYRIKRQNEVALRLLGLSGYERLKYIRSRFKETDCVTSPSGNKSCGQALSQLYFEFGLTDERQWSNFINEVTNHTLDANQNVDLNVVKSRLGFSFDYFFSSKFIASRALWRQEAFTTNSVGPNSQDCILALNNLKLEGIEAAQLPLNHCDLIFAADGNHSSEFMNLVMMFYPIRSVQNNATIFQAVEKNRIPYYYYSGENDIYDVQSETVLAASKQSRYLKYKMYPGRDHYGYFYEKDFWKDLQR